MSLHWFISPSSSGTPQPRLMCWQAMVTPLALIVLLFIILGGKSLGLLILVCFLCVIMRTSFAPDAAVFKPREEVEVWGTGP